MFRGKLLRLSLKDIIISARTYVDPSNGGGKQSRKVGVNKTIIICQKEEEYYLKSGVIPSL